MNDQVLSPVLFLGLMIMEKTCWSPFRLNAHPCMRDGIFSMPAANGLLGRSNDGWVLLLRFCIQR